MDMSKYEVPVDKLRWRCDPGVFDFECTKDLAPLHEFIGQDRAIRAIEFGLSMNRDGYNIYLAGLTGTGKTSVAKAYIQRLIKEKEAQGEVYRVDDWCYVYNFAHPDRPQILDLPRGKGREFRGDVSNLLERLKKDLVKAFSSEDYKAQRKSIAEESQRRQQKLFDEVKREAHEKGFAIQMTPMGAVLVALAKGKPMSQEDFLALKEPVRKKLEATRAGLLNKLQGTLEMVQDADRETAEKVQENDKSIASFTISRLFDSLTKKYSSYERMVEYLGDLKAYTVDNVDTFKEEEKGEAVLGMPASHVKRGEDPFLPFQVNLFVDNSRTEGPPVVIESNPNYANLFGKTERRFLLGGYISDHTMLKPGALQLANGGYLLLNATDVLTNPGVWPALKRAIKTKEVCIEEPYEQFGLIAPQALRPLPMPVEVKIILIGDGMLYQLLSAYDEDFWEIFKVKADFNFEVSKTSENLQAFAAFIAGCCEERQMCHFDRTGVARVLEYASRMVADQEKLSSRFAWIKELIEEAEYWASREGASLVSEQHVEKAIDERRFRHNLPDERMREMIEDGTIMIDTGGAVAGQVNGLSVYALGDVTFGKPSRITCKTFLGRAGVINIEREAKLSGSTHDKGVLILSGYMGWKYAQEHPLSLSASLCFEQSYGGVDGDSASSTELYALLSSLSGVPLGQNIAVTGSVNQKGEVQAIGGVNQKIEGFFQVCQSKNLTGDQGVMIPRQNVRNLMLRDEVIEATKQGKFHIYSVGSIDEGIEILTGVEAGEMGEDGSYPEGSINYRVGRQLKEMAAKLRQFQGPSSEEKKEAHD